MGLSVQGGRVILLTDPSRARQATVEPDQITHADIGARLHNGEAERLTAGVNLGEHVVTITATYADAVPAPRPADVDLVRTVVDVISEGN